MMDGIAEKQLGLALVESNAEDFLDTMRQHARRIARSRGYVTADDLREISADHGPRPEHPNAWGAVFRGRDFVPAGFTASRIPSNHGRVIRRWELRA